MTRAHEETAGQQERTIHPESNQQGGFLPLYAWRPLQRGEADDLSFPPTSLHYLDEADDP